ncbi:MAG: hypothetical protein IT489_06210 [Gammaproteobacteria bacterium]|nr:hypothetical protein [Gammaproteobacteria bacterium]
MKTSIVTAALLFTLAPLALADDTSTIESECKAIAESHGVAADKLDDWMKRCVERTKEMQHRMEEGGKTHGAGPGDMGDAHGKSQQENR